MFRKPNWKSNDTFMVIKPFCYNVGNDLRQVKIGETGKIISFLDFGEGLSMGMKVNMNNGENCIVQDDTNFLFSEDGVI